MEKIDLSEMSSTDARVKYACAKQAIAISKTDPEKLYPELEFFVKLMDNHNNILKWTAIQVIGNLSKADAADRIGKLLPKMFGYLKAGKLITANNTVAALAEIAVNKPEYSNRIVKELLKIEDHEFETPECKNIAEGKVLLALGRLKDRVKNREAARAFVERQTKNSRNATKKKAIELLRKI